MLLKFLMNRNVYVQVKLSSFHFDFREMFDALIVIIWYFCNSHFFTSYPFTVFHQCLEIYQKYAGMFEVVYDLLKCLNMIRILVVDIWWVCLLPQSMWRLFLKGSHVVVVGVPASAYAWVWRKDVWHHFPNR